MSYILDALKKADADRERAAVPGLHARPQDALSAPDESRRALPWPALAATAIVVLGGTLAWVLMSQPDVRLPPVAEATPPVPAAAPTAAPAQVPVPAPAPAPTPAPATTALPTVAEPAPTPIVVLPPPAPAAPPPAPVRAATPPAATTPAAAAPAAARVPTLAELPADLRALLPPLSISGAVYSPTPSARLLFIGGQVLKEGDAVAPGVVVEQIGASASVLSVRGQRFQVSH